MARMADAVHEVPAAWPQSPADLEEILRLRGRRDHGPGARMGRSCTRIGRRPSRWASTTRRSWSSIPLAEVMARFRILTADGDPFPLDRLPGRRAMLGESGPSEILRFQRLDILGDDRWSLVRATPVHRDGELHAIINVFQDITDLKRRELELATLARVGELVGESTDYQTTLQNLAAAVVPQLADWCVVDVFEAGGLNRVAVAHVDPAKVRMVDRRPPAPGTGPYRSSRRYRTPPASRPRWGNPAGRARHGCPSSSGTDR